MARSRSSGAPVLEIQSFAGGSNILPDPNKLEPQFVRKIVNMTLDELGMAAARLGIDAIGTVAGSSARVLSAHVFQRAGVTPQFIVHCDDGTLRNSNDLITWNTFASSLSTTDPFSFVTFVDKVWMTNGADFYRSWDGTTHTTYATVPKMKYLVEWQDTLFGGGNPTDPHRIYSSDAGDGTSWPASNFVDIEKGQGPGITGLSSDANALIVFKLLSHHALYDPVEYTNRVVDNEKGCISHFSIIKHRGLIYFVSHAGICLYLGDAPATIISGNIVPLFKDYVYDEFNETKWWGYAWQDRVGWCFPRDSTTDFWQVEHYPAYPDKPWVFHTIPSRVIVSLRDPKSRDILYGFGEGSNKTYQIYAPDTYDDDGATYLSLIETGWFDFESPFLGKYIDEIFLMCRGDYTVDVLTNFDDSTVVKSYAVSGPDTLNEAILYTDIYCRQIAFRISATSDGGKTDRRFPVGDEVETVHEGKFAIGRLLATAKLTGQYR